jgi:hypothetical protein
MLKRSERGRLTDKGPDWGLRSACIRRSRLSDEHDLSYICWSARAKAAVDGRKS